jgi:hypothetical protein
VESWMQIMNAKAFPRLPCRFLLRCSDWLVTWSLLFAVQAGRVIFIICIICSGGAQRRWDWESVLDQSITPLGNVALMQERHASEYKRDCSVSSHLSLSLCLSLSLSLSHTHTHTKCSGNWEGRT